MAKITENKWTDTTDRIDFPVNTVSNNAQLARSDGSKGAITGITGGGHRTFPKFGLASYILHGFAGTILVLLGR